MLGGTLLVMPNVMNTETLLREVEEVFIPVNKPSGFALSFHKVGCDLCEYLRKDLENYRDRLLPPEAIRYIHGEISCLSAKGWRCCRRIFVTV